jgi:anaerobic magnesium-protoporphyrin IX monomethyl ester cyclase
VRDSRSEPRAAASVALVNPFITSRERYGKDIGDIGGHQMPLGIFSLAASLRAHGYETVVIDAEARHLTHEAVADMLERSGVRAVGITSTTVGYRNAGTLAGLLRSRLGDTPLIIGGPHVTAMPVKTMETGLFDYGIVKEGELPLLELCAFLLRGEGSLGQVPNLLWREGGKIRANRADSVVARLDDLPPPARDLCPDLSVYKPPVGAFRRKPVASVITSRGCPYRCIFCDNNTFGRKVRFFSAGYVAGEIRSLIRDFGVREIAFLDDTFVLDKARLREIFGILRREGLAFPWTCMTRVNNLDYETLKFMRDSGCWQIRIGIESGNQQVLEFIKKGITLEQVRDVAGWCAALGVRTTGFFMVGHHVDTRETIDETIRFALALPLSDVVVTVNTPIPGTESYELAREYGEYREDDWTSLNYWSPVFVPRGLTRELLLEKQAEFYRRFYRRPRVLLGQLGKVRDLRSLGLLARSSVRGYRFTRGDRGRKAGEQA